MKDLQGLLGDLAALAARTEAAEGAILTRARQRNTEVTECLERLQHLTDLDENAAEESRRLTLERAKLAQVIGLTDAE